MGLQATCEKSIKPLTWKIIIVNVFSPSAVATEKTNHIFIYNFHSCWLVVLLATTMPSMLCIVDDILPHHHYIFYNHKSSKLFIPRFKILFPLLLCSCVWASVCESTKLNGINFNRAQSYAQTVNFSYFVCDVSSSARWVETLTFKLTRHDIIISLGTRTWRSTMRWNILPYTTTIMWMISIRKKLTRRMSAGSESMHIRCTAIFTIF